MMSKSALTKHTNHAERIWLMRVNGFERRGRNNRSRWHRKPQEKMVHCVNWSGTALCGTTDCTVMATIHDTDRCPKCLEKLHEEQHGGSLKNCKTCNRNKGILKDE